jgi:hypothetical protein
LKFFLSVFELLRVLHSLRLRLSLQCVDRLETLAVEFLELELVLSDFLKLSLSRLGPFCELLVLPF